MGNDPNHEPAPIQNPIMGLDWQVVDREGNVLGHYAKRKVAEGTAAQYEEAYVRSSSIRP